MEPAPLLARAYVMPYGRKGTYCELVDSTVLTAASALSVAEDFEVLVSRIGSIYPSEVAASLLRLLSTGRLNSELAERLLASARSDSPAPLHHIARGIPLPVPHPLDYDWRFADEVVDEVLQRCMGSGGQIVALGAPSIFRRSVEIGATTSVHLIDASGALAPSFPPEARSMISCCDLLSDPLPSVSARVVIADPPWYPLYNKAFLWAARNMVANGGEILLSVAPVQTRPEAPDERRQLLRWAAAAGLRLTEQHPGALLYRTPPFERNALRAEGIRCPARPWRRGDLWVMSAETATALDRPNGSGSPWTEVTCNRVRLRFRLDRRGPTAAVADPRLVSIISGDVLPSVSRRHPLRSQVDVWTSGNRIYACREPELLCVAAAATTLEVDPLHSAEAHMGRRLRQNEKMFLIDALSQLVDVVRTERIEYADSYDR